MPNNLNSLTRRFNKIIDREIRAAEVEGLKLDVETIFQRVKNSCSMFLHKLVDIFADRWIRIHISHRLKRPSSGDGGRGGGGRRSGGTSDGVLHEVPKQPKQTVFPGMEQLEGYPERLTYEDKPGHVIFVPSESSHEFDWDEAEKYDDRIKQAHDRSNHRLKAGNRFLRTLRRTYGDLSAEELIRKWRADHPNAEETDGTE